MPPQVMRPCRAVPKIPTKSFAPRRLPFYNSRHFLSRSESTLVEVLIPLHFISPRISAYKKTGGGASPSGTKVWQLVTTHRFRTRHAGCPTTPISSCTSALSAIHGMYLLTHHTLRKRSTVRPKLFPRFPQPSICAHTENQATRLLSCVYFITRGHPGGGGLSGTMYTYTGGPRLPVPGNHRRKPFVQLLAGGGRLNASSSGISAGENSFAMAIGGGLDFTIRHRLAIRVIEADYLLTQFAHPDGSSAAQNNVRISAGLVFRFGVRE